MTERAAETAAEQRREPFPRLPDGIVRDILVLPDWVLERAQQHMEETGLLRKEREEREQREREAGNP